MAPVTLLGNVGVRSAGGKRRLLLLMSVGLGWATHSLLANDVVPPEEPTALTVQDVGNNLVLSWQPVATDVTGVADLVPKYRVYSASSADFVPAVAIGEPTTSGFSHTGAFSSPNDYYYLVSAVDDGNVEGNRRSAKVKPVSIVSLSHQAGNGSLTWTPATATPQTQLAGYRVFWGTSSLAYESSINVDSDDTTASFGPLSPGSVYYATVLAIDQEGNLSPFIGQGSVNLSGGGANAPGITATVSPQPNENGWNKTNATITFACSGTGGTVDPNSHTTTAGAQEGFLNPANAWDNNPSSKASCEYNGFSGAFCGGNFGFPNVGMISGRADVTISMEAGCEGGLGGPPRATASYSLNGGQTWEPPFVTHDFTSNQPITFSTPSLGVVNSATFLVRVLGVAYQNCGDATAFVHEIDFVANVSCSNPVTITSEGANQVVAGTATGAGGSTTISVVVNIDKTPPSIESTVAPTPNVADWNRTNAVVTFDCTDGLLSGVESCNGPVTVTTEGEDQQVVAQATDLAGNTGMTTAFVSIDKTAPELTLDQPTGGALFGGLTVPVSGTVLDTNLADVTCNGSAAEVSGVGYSCSLAFPDGSQPTITVQAADLADNTATEAVDVAVDRVGVSILSPAPNKLYGLSDVPSVIVSGTVDDPAATVTVNGTDATVAPSGAFTVSGVTLKEGNNLLTATATAPSGAAGTASVQVTLDAHRPVVLIDSPPNGHQTTAEDIIVAGMLNDIVVGTVNGGDGQTDQTRVEVRKCQPPPCDDDTWVEAALSNRSFSLPIHLDAVAAYEIEARGFDAAENETGQTSSITVTRMAEPTGLFLEVVSGDNQSDTVGSELLLPLRVRVKSGVDPLPEATVIYKVTENDGALRCLDPDLPANPDDPSPCALDDIATTGRSVAVITDENGEAYVHWTLGRRSGKGNNIVEVTAVGAPQQKAFFVASATSDVPAQISVDTGNLQTGAAGEPLPRPFVAVVTDAGHNRLEDVDVTFTVVKGDGSFVCQDPPCTSIVLPTDGDGLAVATLRLGPGEGFDNNVVQATLGQGNPTATFIASGRVPMEVQDTRISGVVVDNTDAPLEGVTMLIHDGDNTIETLTDDQGQFTLFGVPVGNVVLVADPSTIGDGQDWPELHYEMVTVAGRDNTVGMPIYLLPLNPDGTDKVHVTPTQGGTVTLQKIPGFSLEILPNSVTFPGGSKTGDVSVTVVHADKIPMVPTFGAQPRLAITIQPPGAKFDPPAKITFPNVHGLAPGEITELVSFDHDIGQFVSIGTGTVSEDGRVIVSDPGVGILEGGWHDCGCAGPTGELRGNICDEDSVLDLGGESIVPWLCNAGPLSPKVKITGPKSVEHYCAAYTLPNDESSCGTYPAPNITLIATGTPLGGTYLWSIAQGSQRIQLVGTTTSSSVSVQGTASSSSKGDTAVRVIYTVAGAQAVDEHSLTVREPASISSPGATFVPITGPQVWGYEVHVPYTVRDRFGKAVGAGVCVDETNTICNNPFGYLFVWRDLPTDSDGRVTDVLSAVTADPAGLPAGFCAKVDQDVTAGGCGPVDENVLTYTATTATVSTGSCSAGGTCP